MSRLRVAIVGAGIGAEHLAGYLASPDLFDPRVVCDLDRARAEPLLASSGAAYAATLDETLVRDDVDLVDICLPPMLHRDAILAALASGRDVICEKPLVGSLADVDAIEGAVARTGRRVVPIFQYRFGVGIGQLLALRAAGLAGKPLVASIETHWNRGPDYYAVPWRGRWASELGGAVVGHAIHAHDLLAFAFDRVRSVRARLATRVNPIEVEDCAAIALETASGALATSSITLGSADEISRLRLVFDALTAESGRSPYAPGSAPWRFSARDPDAQAAVDAVVAGYVPHAEGYARQLALAHAALAGEAVEPPVTLADARASLELVTAIYASDREDRSVTLPLASDAPGYAGWLPEATSPITKIHSRGDRR